MRLNPRYTSIRLAALAVLALSALAACSVQSGISAPSRPARPDEPARPVVDWSARTLEAATTSPWEVSFCEGEAPFLCITRGGDHAGAIELIDHPMSSPSLDQWAQDHLSWVSTDRTEGCPAGYRIEGDPVRGVEVAGRDGVRLSFTGFDEAGRKVERVVLHAFTQLGRHYIISAAGYEEGSCLGRQLSDFTAEELETLEPLLDSLAAGSRVETPIVIDE